MNAISKTMATTALVVASSLASAAGKAVHRELRAAGM